MDTDTQLIEVAAAATAARLHHTMIRSANNFACGTCWMLLALPRLQVCAIPITVSGDVSAGQHWTLSYERAVAAESPCTCVSTCLGISTDCSASRQLPTAHIAQ